MTIIPLYFGFRKPLFYMLLFYQATKENPTELRRIIFDTHDDAVKFYERYLQSTP